MLNFLYTAVSWVLLRWHDLFTTLGFSQTSGWGWTLSIIFLVITARVLLFRLFIKQVHYTRNMQRMQPKISKLREKYKDDRAELNRQMMALQQEEGFNPLAGCLPMLLQFPVFIGLFHTLRHLSNSVPLCQHYKGSTPSAAADRLLNLYTFSRSETCNAAQAKILNSPLAASFHDSGAKIRELGGDPASTRWVLVVLLVISAAATLSTQLLVRANATTVPEGTAATVQRLMMWLIPIGVLASGLLFNFPLGVLLYWFTNNLWTLSQQGYIIRYHPPTEPEQKPVGEVGRTLAPKVGQKPVRETRTGVISTTKAPPAGKKPSQSAPSGSSAKSPAAAGSGASRGGEAGQRPVAKRPTKAKKRR